MLEKTNDKQIGFQELWGCSSCETVRSYGLRHENTTRDGHGHIFKEGAMLHCDKCLCLTRHYYMHENKKIMLKDFSKVLP